MGNKQPVAPAAAADDNDVGGDDNGGGDVVMDDAALRALFGDDFQVDYVDNALHPVRTDSVDVLVLLGKPTGAT